MIPLHLFISGFLSYREPVELDFTAFELACISGPNGAGKSSLLDAMTWALFGQARKRDDSLINAQSSVAQACLTFAYEGNIFRVQRTKPRDKTAMLDFQILQQSAAGELRSGFSSSSENGKTWKTLNEHTLRDTENRIQQTLRLDYETFVNAAFFLQGKADQFTQQRPGDRKRILGSILGLEVWETYRQRAVERRKAIETEINSLDGRLHEIAAELVEEESRKERLKQLESDLERLSRERAIQETALENIRRIAAMLEENNKRVEEMARQLEITGRRLGDLEARLAARCQERDTFAALTSRAVEIQAAYRDWQAARLELEAWEETAARFREHEKRRAGPRDEINAARARLVQELQTLQSQHKQAELWQAEINQLQSQASSARQELALSEERLNQRVQLDAELQTARQRTAEAKAENPRLKAEMEELKERINQLNQAEGVVCPVCGQALSPKERHKLVAELETQGKELGDRYRANLALLRQSEGQVQELEQKIRALAQVENELRTLTQSLAQTSGRLELLESQTAAWHTSGAPRLGEIELALEGESYAPEARQRLAEIDAELRAIGYDAAAHDAARKAEVEGRASENELRALERAQATLAPLEREIADLQSQLAALQADVARQRQDHQEAAANLAAAQAQAPDLYAAEGVLLGMQEQENRLRLEVGAARQKVLVLGDLKARQKNFIQRREELAGKVGQYKQLERAFGKDGIPALLIEQALPEIERRANEILDRLSGGSMSVRFITQSAYKDKRRDDLRETLDIQISDGAGTRDFEMFSGGESFRVNFAIRLALSEVLAQRAGARLQTLFVDEGFGSQDALGRQRLIEAINLVRQDFAKILVITHIDELKDIFPTRIEVEKTDRGSMVRVV